MTRREATGQRIVQWQAGLRCEDRQMCRNVTHSCLSMQNQTCLMMCFKIYARWNTLWQWGIRRLWMSTLCRLSRGEGKRCYEVRKRSKKRVRSDEGCPNNVKQERDQALAPHYICQAPSLLIVQFMHRTLGHFRQKQATSTWKLV